MRRWPWIKRVCSSWAGPCLIIPTIERRAEPTLAAIPWEIGTPEAAALDAGYFGPATRASCAKRGIEPYIATGRDPHHASWQQRFAPVIGIIKEVLGFRQFSLRGTAAAAGEWCLVCLAFNLKRFHTLSWA
jgi:Transposase DDE domain